ncbi:MAG: hypothetical protein V7609_1377 [Verrucomicrobiota bacterium]
MKDIWKALVIAFLLFIIPLIWNAVTQGGLIRVLGGVTREELNGAVIALKARGTDKGLAMSPTTPNVYGDPSNPRLSNQQWELYILK